MNDCINNLEQSAGTAKAFYQKKIDAKSVEAG